MKWFRLYTEARTDAKLRRLTRDQHWAWFQLLCYAAEQENRGVIQYRNDEVLAAEVTDGDVALLHETLKRLETLTIVTWNVTSRFITFSNFEKRQFGGVTRNGKSSTDRVRKWREEQRLKQSETHETRAKRTETIYVTGETRPDTDTDSEFHTQTRARETEDEARTQVAPAQAVRTPEDLAEVNEACLVLGSHIDTEHVGMELGRQHSLPELLKIAGWQWFAAAKKIADGGMALDKRQSFAYLRAIARRTTERHREQKFVSRSGGSSTRRPTPTPHVAPADSPFRDPQPEGTN